MFKICNNKNMKIGWICAGSINSGGSRMSVFNNHEYLISLGIDSRIIHSPINYCIEYNPTDIEVKNIINEKFDIIFIQKVSMGSIKNAIKLFQSNKTKVIFGIGDFFGQEMVEICDLTVAASDYLKKLYPSNLQHKIHVIMDGYETSYDLNKDHKKSNIVNVIYYGTQNLDIKFEEKIKSIDWINFKKLGNPPWTDIPWTLESVYNNILKFDICLIYAEMNDFNKSKSLNRPLNCMAMGIPVVSSPIPSYDTIIEHNINGFIVNSNKFEDFKIYFSQLRDFQFRKEIGINAKKSVIDNSKNNQAKDFLLLFEKALKS